jgi:hypothetical protein
MTSRQPAFAEGYGGHEMPLTQKKVNFLGCFEGKNTWAGPDGPRGLIRAMARGLTFGRKPDSVPRQGGSFHLQAGLLRRRKHDSRDCHH